MKFDFEISSVLKFRNKIAEIFHFSIKFEIYSRNTIHWVEDLPILKFKIIENSKEFYTEMQPIRLESQVAHTYNSIVF